MSVTLFTGGTVITTALTGATTHALLIRDGVVSHTGDEALALRDTADQVIDLEGGTVVPGIGDGHCHPLFGAYEQLGPNIGDATSVAEIQDAVRVWIEEHPDATWVLGGSYDITLAEDANFEAAWLDEVTGDIPTALRAFDHHTIWVNSAALRAAGYTRDTVDPPLGKIERHADGTPTGTLREAAANNLIDHIAPERTRQERVWAIGESHRQYAAQGTTWIQDAWVEPRDVDAYIEAAKQDTLTIRVNLALRADPVRWRDQIDEFVTARDRIQQVNHPLLTANTVKFFLDGVIEGRTAWLEQPYTVDTENYGIGNWSVEEVREAAAACNDAGFQLHLHAIGDRANRVALDTLEAVGPELPPVVAHVALVNPDQVTRFAGLGVIANFEPYWAQNDPVMQQMTVPFIGEERQYWQYPIGSVVRSGGHVSFGSDWPVSTADWRPAFSVAVTHIDPSDTEGKAWIPEERISAHEALSAYTQGIAYQALAPDRGTLEVGQTADLVWLSTNPLESDHLPEINVIGTWVAGNIVY
ncbi:MAG: amidohydrolase [Canibacter sp.]